MALAQWAHLKWSEPYDVRLSLDGAYIKIILCQGLVAQLPNAKDYMPREAEIRSTIPYLRALATSHGFTRCM